MATTATTTTVTAGDPNNHHRLHLNSIPTIDLRLLSQSELYSLSKHSNSSSTSNLNDVVIPKIDRSVFNESAGSRKQTYSRLRLLPATSSASVSSTAVLHRTPTRTPHLRASVSRTAGNLIDNDIHYNDNDPEQVENSQIIRVLKELFNCNASLDSDVDNVKNDVGLVSSNPSVSDSIAKNDAVYVDANPNVNESVPVEVRNDESVKNVKNDVGSSSIFKDSVPVESVNDENVNNDEYIKSDVVSESLNTEMKRKRGRPRKNENAVLVSSPEAKRMRNSYVKKLVVYDNDRDKEILNCNGDKVNLAELGRLEDPYGPEIRRRTEGMTSQDELLGFMRGLNGEWGTTRKKRRVVDASDFGVFLPNGWRLSLAVKRKDNRVWLFCRRYLSPSGRQFESCKDASMYLVSIVGEENLDNLNFTQNIDCDDSALKGALGNATELHAQEDLKGDSVVHSISEPPISLPSDFDKQVASDIVDSVSVQAEEVYKCLKCCMTFKGRIDLLDHEALVHKEDLAPIEVKRDDINSVVSESLNNKMKLKRGRPRKNENAIFTDSPATKRMCNDTTKKLIVYDNAKDREIVNCRGVKVNLVNLGRLEDPYALEIRRRTEGMLTQDELLGFMRGLNGQWGTTRKKRRVVDASDFGDALPKGWKLSLAVKRKGGHVWLFCRRYISPSGRQFESCKEISTYLLSVVGEENLDKPNCDNSSLEGASGNATDDYAGQEGAQRTSPIHNPSASPISSPTHCEKKVIFKSVEPVQVEEIFKCLKCFMIFEGKIDLLDHQALAHKDERSQLGSETSDWSIVIGGIFECNLCHQTFYEKNQYNAHIGTHDTKENMTYDASETPLAEQTSDPVMISSENYVARENYDALFDDTLISGSPESDHNVSSGIESKADKLVHDLNMNGDVLAEESGDRTGNNCNEYNNEDFVPKSDFCLGDEASMSINKSNGEFKTSGQPVDCNDDISECIPDQGTNPASCRFSSLSNEQMDGGCAVIENDIGHISYGHDAVSDANVQTSSICEKKGFQENINDTHICSSFGELPSEKEIAFGSDSLCEVSHGDLAFDEDGLTEGKKLSNSESLSLFSQSSDTYKAVNNASMVSSKEQESSQKVGCAGVHQVPHGFDENRFSYDIARSKVNEQYEVRSTYDGYKEKEPVSKQNVYVGNNMNNVSLDKSRVANLGEFQAARNNESINNGSLSSRQNGLNAGVMPFNTGKNLEVSSLASHENEQAFGFQDDVSGLYDNTQESSERGLLDHFCVAETSDDIFGNKIYSTPLDGLKFDEGVHELSLAFGNSNPHALYADTISVNEQKKDGVNSALVPSKIEEPFDVQTDLSMVNNSMVEDLRRGSDSVSESFSLSCSGESRALQHNGNSGYLGGTWQDLRSNEFRSSEDHKFMVGSGSNQSQCNEGLPRGMWKPNQANQLQSGLVNPHAPIQSAGFHTFDIMSDKAEDGVLRFDGRYNDSLSTSKSEPVEFRFLTGRSDHNPHALQGGSRVSPYNAGMEQGFDSTFWMGKNGMMPNMGGRNMVTSICAWCRNEFHLPAMAFHFQTQSGVGSLCPTCSAGMSGRANML
uniref:uncharacterized protein LOC122586818 n=1 Tax=Erigeron canadensis TaxID=72917 RepID=UPI001CB8E0F2|nr:uncharacterized protein LOC122586818 [Erigeron canadensis]XP_043614746.1 uncharacterized protein LOC122586818 [Erigeron canadensis]